jgi:hypothetical protein
VEVLLQYLTVDNILKATAIVGGIISFAVYIRTELAQLRIDVTQIKSQQMLLMDSIKQLNNILTQIAVQDVRISMIEKDIDEIRHGKGMIS